MSQLPARRENRLPSSSEELEPRETGGHFGPVTDAWGTLVRNRWLILLCMIGVTAGAAYYTQGLTPVYEASASLRIEEKESNLPEIFRTVTARGVIETEAEVLRSRRLSEEATDLLALRVRLKQPERIARDGILEGIQVSSKAVERTYRLTRVNQNQFDLVHADSGRHLAYVRPGLETHIDGLSFTLAPTASEHEEITFSVTSRIAAAQRVASRLSIAQPNRDSRVINLRYEDSDPELVWRVPNAVVNRYLARRQDLMQSEARRMVAFLEDQIERIAKDMAAAEETFREYRERSKVIAPDVEASSQVTRLVQKESELSSIEAERRALGNSLREVREAALSRKPDGPSPYRKLIGLPFLIRNQAAAQLLSSLAAVEDERTSLLVRRTPQDTDVQVLDNRISEIEAQLFGIASTYLRGLENQVASLEASLQGFDRQLATIPRRQVEYARLERKSKGLEEVYNLLQTRLQEAEIAQAAQDASVQIVDTAVAPSSPSRPQPVTNVLGGIIAGALLGMAVAFAREQLDRSIHTRKDVLAATGLSVLGLIPHIRKGRGRLALITQPLKTRPGRQPSPSPNGVGDVEPNPGSNRHHYTFLHGLESSNLVPLPQAPEGRAPTLQLVVANPGSVEAEAYSILQTNLSFARVEHPVKSLVLTSPLPGDGKTTNAINLASTMAERGLRTLLVDADLRRGTVHAAMSFPRDPGLTDVLTGSSTLAAVLRSVSVGPDRTLEVLTTGRLTHSPTPLLESQAMRSLMAELREEYDFIVVDAPPVNIVTDAALLGALADGVLVVARAGTTDAAALSHAVQQLRHVRATILGVLLNDINFRRDASYDGAYRFYTYDQYSASSGPSS